MLEVIEFGLENTFIKDRFGGLRRQVKGNPKGDPSSPGMCIGACAWMEMEWMKGHETETKKRFRAIRYMDDVLMIINDKGWKKADAWFGVMEKVGGCYPAPLSLKQDDGKLTLPRMHNP